VGSGLRHALQIAAKDLLLELRTGTGIVSAAAFAAMVLVVFQYGRDPTAVPTIQLAPTILWITCGFSAMLALNRAFQLELENSALDALLLSPISRTSLYWGKLLANLVFVAGVELIAFPLWVLFFNVPVGGVLGPLLGIMALATVGFVAVGTLFSVMVIRTRFAELLLIVLLLPFLVTPLAGAVKLTAALLAGRPLSEVVAQLKLLAAYDIVFVTLGTLLFPATVDQ
jgi:heme exporter protein B